MAQKIDKLHAFECTEEELDALSIGTAELPYERRKGFLALGYSNKYRAELKKESERLKGEFKRMPRSEFTKKYNAWALGLYKKVMKTPFLTKAYIEKKQLEKDVYCKELKLIRECGSPEELEKKLQTFPHKKDVQYAYDLMDTMFRYNAGYKTADGQEESLPKSKSLRYIALFDTTTYGDIVPYIIADQYHFTNPTYAMCLSREETLFLMTAGYYFSYPEEKSYEKTKINVFSRPIAEMAISEQKKWFSDRSITPRADDIILEKYNDKYCPRVISGRALELPIQWNGYCDIIHTTHIAPEKKDRAADAARKKQLEDFLNS